jgi:hypothetical protein
VESQLSRRSPRSGPRGAAPELSSDRSGHVGHELAYDVAPRMVVGDDEDAAILALGETDAQLLARLPYQLRKVT